MNHHFTTVKELPDSEKPYEKFLISGVESLSDAELIAVIIRSGTRGRVLWKWRRNCCGRTDTIC